MELEAELENMRELLSKAKGVNDAMWKQSSTSLSAR